MTIEWKANVRSRAALSVGLSVAIGCTPEPPSSQDGTETEATTAVSGASWRSGLGSSIAGEILPRRIEHSLARRR